LFDLFSYNDANNCYVAQYNLKYILRLNSKINAAICIKTRLSQNYVSVNIDAQEFSSIWR